MPRHRAPVSPPSPACWLAVAVTTLVPWPLSPPVGSAADAPATFEPGEISIGEPIALPFSPDSTPATAAAVPPARALPPVTADATAKGTPGSGWLGLSVAESNVPGRWRVDDVVAGGPAAKAGIRPGDELRAIEGVPLAAADDVSAVLATIAAGQEVRVAVAQADATGNDTVGDLVLRAEPRPAPRQLPQPPLGTPQAAPTVAAPTVAAPAVAAPAWAPQPAAPQAAVPPAAAHAVPQSVVSQSAVPAWQPVGEIREPQPLPSALPAPIVAPPAARLQTAAPPDFAPSQPARSAVEQQGRQQSEQHGSEGHRGRTALGVRTVPIDPVLQARFSLSEPAGAYVIGVVHDLPASRAGVPPGSVIVALNDRPVRSPTELTRLVTDSPVDRPVAVQFVLPGGEAKRTDVILQALSAPLEQALIGEPSPGEPSLPGRPEATAVPTLEPGPVPQRVERAGGGDAEAEVRAEIRWLRQRLDRLERRLEQPGPTVLR